jgi:hypothetical protein
MTLPRCSKRTISFSDCSCPHCSGCCWGFPVGHQVATSLQSIFHVFCVVLLLPTYLAHHSSSRSEPSTYRGPDLVQGLRKTRTNALQIPPSNNLQTLGGRTGSFSVWGLRLWWCLYVLFPLFSNQIHGRNLPPCKLVSVFPFTVKTLQSEGTNSLNALWYGFQPRGGPAKVTPLPLCSHLFPFAHEEEGPASFIFWLWWG